jgi:tRNA threonylcarbamoyladenosine biosynthesis protein TsaE
VIELPDEEATAALGRRLAGHLRVGDVVGLSGGLGAGKTVFARGVLEGLGHVGEVPSPSFPIVIPYEPPVVRLPVAHVDLYRVDDVGDLREFGLDEVTSYGVLLIEWPERLPQGAWPEMLALSLVVGVDDSRCLTAKVPPAWSSRWPIQ